MGVVGALVALAGLTLLPIFGFPPSIEPYNHDNIWALSLGADSIESYFTETADGSYRPVAYLTLWAQYHMSGFDPSAYFSINIALWIGCAGVVYALGYVVGGSWLAAGVAAALLLIDGRGMTAVVWIPERATTFACVMGGIALLLAYRLPSSGRTRAAALAVIAALLLGAALSKEYAVAFAAATATVGVVTRPGDRRGLVAVAVAAVTVYAGMRALLPADPAQAAVGGAGYSALDKCDYIGFLGHGENVCYGDLDLIDRLLRWGWNAGATLVATFVPPLFTGYGALLLPDVLAGPLGEDYPGFASRKLILPLLVSVCAFVGLRRHPRAVAPLFALIVANAALNFLLFRDRNQVVGLIGLYAAAAVGMPVLASAALARTRAFVRGARSSAGTRARAVLPLAALAAVVGAIVWQAADFHREVDGAKGAFADRDPCPQIRNYETGVAEQLRAELGPRARNCGLIEIW